VGVSCTGKPRCPAVPSPSPSPSGRGESKRQFDSALCVHCEEEPEHYRSHRHRAEPSVLEPSIIDALVLKGRSGSLRALRALRERGRT
jgi:hypothetical protein